LVVGVGVVFGWTWFLEGRGVFLPVYAFFGLEENVRWLVFLFPVIVVGVVCAVVGGFFPGFSFVVAEGLAWCVHGFVCLGFWFAWVGFV